MASAGQAFWAQALAQAGDVGAAPAWLGDARDGALRVLAARGLPTRAEEDWHYTDLNAYAHRGADYLQAGSRAGSPVSPGLAVPGAVTLAIRDGLPDDPPAQLPAGLQAHRLAGLPGPLQAEATRLLQLCPDTGLQPMVALNTALLRDGLLLATSPGAQVQVPVHVACLATGQPVIAQPRLLVSLAPGSALTLVLEHGGAPGALVNSVVQARCGAGARLELLRAQALDDDGYLTETLQADLDADASLTGTTLELGAALSRLEFTLRFRGAGARAAVAGASLADGERHLDTQTRLIHTAPRTTSRQIFRSLADGRARVICNGKIIVEPGAAGTDASLQSRGLLLARTAELDTKPELEIRADDVRCSHGASIGQLDANALFYLRSRGLDAAEARHVLMDAFLREVLEGVGHEGLRAILDERIKARLSSLRLGAVP